MERVMSQEERIRRAEEIYYRRQNQGVRVTTSSVNVSKANKISLGKKMCIQITICVIIYSFFYVIRCYNNILGQNVINTTKNILSYDINLSKMYKDSMQYMEYFKNNFNNILSSGLVKEKNVDEDSKELDKEIQNLENQNITEQNDENANLNEQINESNETNQNVLENNENVQNTQETELTNSTTITNNNELNENNNSENTDNETPGIGGGSDISTDNTLQNKSQMELDADYIKQNCSLIIPVQGRVTSGYGNREPTEIISAFHQGIDIGAVTGTSIHASMEGNVVAASYAGDYGNHIKIQNGDILTVYAHCSEINVCVGDYVQQGQEIGKVGSTGKVTGPHLHFEIRKENRYVDPSMVLNF